MPISAEEFNNNEDLAKGLHLNGLEIVIFDFLERNRDTAFTQRELEIEIFHRLNDKGNTVFKEKLKQMVSEGKIGGKFVKEKGVFY